MRIYLLLKDILNQDWCRYFRYAFLCIFRISKAVREFGRRNQLLSTECTRDRLRGVMSPLEQKVLTAPRADFLLSKRKNKEPHRITLQLVKLQSTNFF